MKGGVMPKERIGAGGPFSIEVTWGRDSGAVQVASVAADPLNQVAAILADCGLSLVDAESGAAPGTAQLEGLAPLLAGWYVDLDERRDLNRLVHVLRTARDQAMGRDA